MVIKFPIRYSTGGYWSPILGIWEAWHYRGWEITKFIDEEELFIIPPCNRYIYDYAKTLKQAINIIDKHEEE